ncbi:uncharacterized protein LOC123566600 isoform X2 [Mercenaria mercenaria]|uniref:uncharacterized protein LOC123566600 isoform X2 n=1 Tax=Mercenaria mercenaria TaxID=6596 RepID=UPI00234E4166|nr:uncharacterized protein LOC123566600 isoform X2 [Mercenaria mercenaria]
MENETKVIEMLSDTKAKLDDIKDLNREIHNALDLIEERRNKQKTEAHMPRNKDASGENASKSSVPDDKVAFTPGETSTDTAAVVEVERKEVKEQLDTESPHTEKRPREGSTDDMNIKPKGILKVCKEGSKLSYGFKERLDLNVDHVMYGSQLRRNAVEMHQDNRLCLQFGLNHNIGSEYESKRPFPGDTKDAVVPKPPVHTNNQRSKQVTLQGPETNVVKTPKTNDRRGTSASKSSHGHSTGSRTATQPDKHERQRKAKAVRKQSEPNSDIAVVQRNTNMGRARGQQEKGEQKVDMLSELMKMGGNPLLTGQITKADWINMITECSDVHGMDEEQKRQMYETVADTFFGEGQSFNIGYFFNMSKDQFMEKIMQMWQVDQSIGEREKRLIADELSKNFFDENGKMDLLKCVKEAQPFMKGGLQQFQSVVVKALEGKTADSPEVQSEDSDTQQDEASFQTSVPVLQRKKEASDDDTENNTEDRLDIDPALWTQYANEEVQKGRVAQDVREKGMDSIICVDLSHSMRGAAWQQATTFIKNFVEGIQNSTLMDAAYEHIALVTFGSETRVQQHLTCDYVEIIRKLDRLKPSGPSPMYAGLQMVHAAILGAGMVFKSNGYKMYPRVFLITDGKATPVGMIAGPDQCLPDQLLQEQLPILDVVKTIHDKYHVTFNPVPVGDFNLSILENIVKISKGKIISPEDWRLQSRVFKNYLAAAKVCGGPFAKFLAPGLSSMMLGAIECSPEDKLQMEEFIRTHGQEDDEDSEDHEEDDFPPLGSRIRLHVPGATIMAESKQALGTVTKHFTDGHIGVTWDQPNAQGSIREKMMYQDSLRSVTVTDEPRVLHEEMIAEGCRVKRGKDWRYPDQDGGAGNLGYVYSVKQNGIVSVRWDNGDKYTYKFGAEGKFDLEIVGHNEEIIKKEEVSVEEIVPADEESEEKRVQKMNERNRSIYDSENSEKLEIEGATAQPLRQQPDRDGGESLNKTKRTGIQNVDSDNKNGCENIVSRSENIDIDERNRRNIANSNTTTVGNLQANLDTNFVNAMEGNSSYTGAKPKTGLLKQTGQETEKRVQWMWQDGNTWREYPPDISEKIETGFKRNPKGTTLIRLHNKPYRVVFPRMEQVNIETKEKHTVVRNT